MAYLPAKSSTLERVFPAALSNKSMQGVSLCSLQFNRAAVEAAFAGGAEVDEDGIEDAFELVAEVPEKIR